MSVERDALMEGITDLERLEHDWFVCHERRKGMFRLLCMDLIALSIPTPRLQPFPLDGHITGISETSGWVT